MTGHRLLAEPAGFDGASPFVLAYVGPGAGLAAIGALLTMAGVAVFMLVGFVWYPMLRLLEVWRRPGEGAGRAKLEDRYSPADRLLHVALVDYDGLCAGPAPALRRIAGRIGLAGAAALAGAAGRFRAPTRYDADAPDADGELLEKASALHRELLRRSRD